MHTAPHDSAPEALHRALCVAVLGAESTGKTTLAQTLAETLSDAPAPGAERAQPGPTLRAAWVPEVLRQWCQQQGRTPRAHEQAAIMEAQHRHLEAAARRHDLVVCDTTALMTAVYSACIFGDRSLHPRAVQLQQTMDLTLLMALDLPWVADGYLRDGPQVQRPVDQALRQLLVQHGLPFTVVKGSGAARVQQALEAVVPVLRARQALRGQATDAPGSSLPPPAAGGPFARLQSARPAAAAAFRDHGDWWCACCRGAPDTGAWPQQA